MITESLSLTDVAILAVLFIALTFMIVVLYLKMMAIDRGSGGWVEAGERSENGKQVNRNSAVAAASSPEAGP